MNEPAVIYMYMEELIEKGNWDKAIEYAQKLDNGKIGYFVRYVITKQVISDMKKDGILEEYYEFKKGGLKCTPGN